MSRPIVTVNASYANGATVDTLSRTLRERMKYLNESASQSIHATAENALRSIRALTLVAKANGLKVTVEPRADLVFGYTYLNAAATGSKATAKMCLRSVAGVRYVPPDGVKVRFAACRGQKVTAVRVYEYRLDFKGEKTTYLIAAPSQSLARKAAQKILAARILRYSGLAKRAVSQLMIRANTRGPADLVGARVYRKAQELTEARNVFATDSTGGGKYGLLLYDNVSYAARALKGGRAAVDLALRKAANKTAALIQHKCRDLLLPGEIKTPFPGIVGRRAG